MGVLPEYQGEVVLGADGLLFQRRNQPCIDQRAFTHPGGTVDDHQLVVIAANAFK